MNIDYENFVVIGNEDATHRNEVDLIVTKNIEVSVTNFDHFSDRLLLLQLKGGPININIINCPTVENCKSK